MQLVAYCEACRHRHPIGIDPAHPDNQIRDWYAKHAGHIGVGVCWPQRSPKPSFVDRLRRFWRFARRRPGVNFNPNAIVAEPQYPFAGDPGVPVPDALLAYLANANVKVAYAASAAVTITLASLAASNTLLSGQQSDNQSNTSNLYLDYLVGATFKSGAANNQAGSIILAAVGQRDDTPTYPDVFTNAGTAAKTVSKQGIFDQVCKVAINIAADNTASQSWWGGPVSVAALFGGAMPGNWLYFVTQNIQTSTNIWSATAGDFAVENTGVYLTVI